MGTHPIFESDFDCLTDERMESVYTQLASISVAVEELLIFIDRNKPFRSIDKIEFGNNVNKFGISFRDVIDNFKNFNSRKIKEDIKKFENKLRSLQVSEVVEVTHGQMSHGQMSHGQTEEELIQMALEESI